MELIIQKSVELGANKIVPVDTKYCVTKMKDEDNKIVRWNTISEAAAKQSKRTVFVLTFWLSKKTYRTAKLQTTNQNPQTKGGRASYLNENYCVKSATNVC